MKNTLIVVFILITNLISVSAQDNIYNGTVSYAHKDGDSKAIRYKKELSTVEGEYVTKYKIFDEDGKLYSTIIVIHNRLDKSITIDAKPPSVNVFKDGVYHYDLTYTDDLGLSMTIEDKIGKLFGDGRKNTVSLKFYSAKREHIKLLEIMTGDTDVNYKFHYYLDK